MWSLFPGIMDHFYLDEKTLNDFYERWTEACLSYFLSKENIKQYERKR